MSQYCPICDSVAQLVRERRELALGRREAVVEHEFYGCSACGESWYTSEQMDQAQRRAADKIRAEEGLLAPSEIKAIREAFELSQADFERLLGFGPKTVGRWERGSVFQNQSSDVLMRVVREYPEVLRFLAGKHDVELPADGEWSRIPEKKVAERGITEERAFESTRPVPKDMHDIFRPTHSGFSPLVVQIRKENAAEVQQASKAS